MAAQAREQPLVARRVREIRAQHQRLVAQLRGADYFDLTEGVPTTRAIRELSETGTAVMAPQCGLAPGLVGVVGASLAAGLEGVCSIRMRVGGLPRHPSGRAVARCAHVAGAGS